MTWVIKLAGEKVNRFVRACNKKKLMEWKKTNKRD